MLRTCSVRRFRTLVNAAPRWRRALVAGWLGLSVFGCEPEAGESAAPPTARVAPGAAADALGVDAPAADALAAYVSPERGRYLVKVGGCNDCHTPGFMEKGFAIPESEWLTGVPVGWKGPWGTTYASNLRRFVKDFDEDTFVQTVRARNSRPPMPWPNLHAMSDGDLRSLFRYIKGLPLTGEAMPEYVAPGREPKTAYIDMTPRPPRVAQAASARDAQAAAEADRATR
jgi:mono/diheme cytochrome c family protein